MPAAKAKPATVVVYPEDGPAASYDLASDKDWSIIFDDVLEIKAAGGAVYYPLGAVMRWLVR